MLCLSSSQILSSSLNALYQILSITRFTLLLAKFIRPWLTHPCGCLCSYTLKFSPLAICHDYLYTIFRDNIRRSSHAHTYSMFLTYVQRTVLLCILRVTPFSSQKSTIALFSGSIAILVAFYRNPKATFSSQSTEESSFYNHISFMHCQLPFIPAIQDFRTLPCTQHTAITKRQFFILRSWPCHRIHLFHFPSCSINSSPTGSIPYTLIFTPFFILWCYVRTARFQHEIRKFTKDELQTHYIKKSDRGIITSKLKSKYLSSLCKKEEIWDDSIKQILWVLFLLSAF